MATSEKTVKDMDYYLARSEKRQYIGNQIKRVLYGGLSTALTVTAVATPDFFSKAIVFGATAFSNVRFANKGNEIHEYREKNGLYKPKIFAKFAEKHPKLSKSITRVSSAVMSLGVPVLVVGAATSFLPLTPALGAASFGISGAYYLAKKSNEWNYSQKRRRSDKVNQELAKYRGCDNPLRDNQEQVKEQSKDLNKLPTPHKETLEENAKNKLSLKKEKSNMNIKDKFKNLFLNNANKDQQEDIDYDDTEDEIMVTEEDPEYFDDDEFFDYSEDEQEETEYVQESDRENGKGKPQVDVDFFVQPFSSPKKEPVLEDNIITIENPEQLTLKNEIEKKQEINKNTPRSFLPHNVINVEPPKEIIAESPDQFTLKSEEEKIKLIPRTYEFAPTQNVLSAIADRIVSFETEGEETKHSKESRAKVGETFELSNRIKDVLSELEGSNATYTEIKKMLQSNRTDINFHVNIDENKLVEMIKDGSFKEGNALPYAEIVKDVTLTISLDGEERGTVSLSNTELDSITKCIAIKRAQEITSELNLDKLREEKQSSKNNIENKSKNNKNKNKTDIER